MPDQKIRKQETPPLRKAYGAAGCKKAQRSQKQVRLLAPFRKLITDQLITNCLGSPPITNRFSLPRRAPSPPHHPLPPKIARIYHHGGSYTWIRDRREHRRFHACLCGYSKYPPISKGI